MKREIKFRAKTIEGGEWVYGYLLHLEPPLQCFEDEKSQKGDTFIFNTGDADWNMPRPMDMYPVDPETVGQFIGMNDGEGQPIFEDDIVEDWQTASGHKSPIVFIQGEFHAEGFDYKGFLELCVRGRIHVVGNIHDNPELLEVKA